METNTDITTSTPRWEWDITKYNWWQSWTDNSSVSVINTNVNNDTYSRPYNKNE
jgi:hypothetical protein